jgi:hypothetical protein
MRSSSFGDARVLVRRFSDARPREAARSLGGVGFIAPSGYRSQYTTGYVKRKGRATTAYHGSLPTDMPYLLARSLPGDNVRAADELPDAGASGPWDYVVEGRLLTTRFTSWVHIVLAVLGVVGPPGRFERYELSFELSVYATTDPGHPLFTRTYAFDERVNVGLYYGHERSERLTLHALESLLAESARDLVTEIEKHQTRRGER